MSRNIMKNRIQWIKFKKKFDKMAIFEVCRLISRIYRTYRVLSSKLAYPSNFFYFTSI